MVVRGSAYEAASRTSCSGRHVERGGDECVPERAARPAAIPARRATRGTIRPAPCRSRRCLFTVRKTSPSQRSPMARLMARGARREWDGDDLAALVGRRASRSLGRGRSPRSLVAALLVCVRQSSSEPDAARPRLQRIRQFGVVGPRLPGSVWAECLVPASGGVVNEVIGGDCTRSAPAAPLLRQDMAMSSGASWFGGSRRRPRRPAREQAVRIAS